MIHDEDEPVFQVSGDFKEGGFLTQLKSRLRAEIWHTNQ